MVTIAIRIDKAQILDSSKQYKFPVFDPHGGVIYQVSLYLHFSDGIINDPGCQHLGAVCMARAECWESQGVRGFERDPAPVSVGLSRRMYPDPETLKLDCCFRSVIPVRLVRSSPSIPPLSPPFPPPLAQESQGWWC